MGVMVSNNGAEPGTGRAGFTYESGGSVSWIKPSSGPKRGGTVVTVTGSNLDSKAARTECVFGAEAVSGSLGSDSTVVCTAPGSTQAQVTVALRQDGALLEGAATYGYFEAPTVEAIWPSRGSVTGGAVVSVQGANLRRDGLACRFGATTVTGAGARLVTSTLAACIAPAYVGTEGRVIVEVSINDGIDFITNGKEFAYGAVSVVEGLKPSQVRGGQGGQMVSVFGQSFQQTAELKCRFGLDTTTAAVYMTSTLVTCTVPVKESGAVTVSFADSVTTGSALLAYAVTGARIVSSTPTRGSLSGGTTVMIVVQELDMALGDTIRCQFGEELADGEVVDANTARCWAPPGTAGETVVVRLQHGSDGMYTRGAGAFEYISALRLFT